MMKENTRAVFVITSVILIVVAVIMALVGGSILLVEIVERTTVEPEQTQTLPPVHVDDYCNISDHIIDHQYGCVACRSITSTDRKLWFDLMCRACFDAGRPVTVRMIYLGQHHRQEATQ